MCPPLCNPTLLNSSIGDSWSDEELVRFLAESKADDSLPANVLVGTDLTLIDPQDFSPGNIWFLNRSDDQQPHGNGESAIRKAKGGYWKCIDVLRIPTSKSIAGMKFSLEFYEGEAPSGTRTQWVMHEYQVEQNDEANVPQEYKFLCTIFMQASKMLVTEDEQLSLSTNAPNDCLESYLQCLDEMKEQNVAINSKILSSSQQNSSSRKGKDIYETYSAADGIDFVHVLSNEDYIEMKDLLRSDGSASTSEYSSRRSEEYFHSDALLRELLNDRNTTREIMCHSLRNPTLQNSSISDSWSDEDLVGFLAERKDEDFLPKNVIVGMDLSLIDPQDSPGNMWYLNRSDDQQPCGNGESAIRKANGGYWKHKDVLRIPINKSISGVKFILEFYEGEAPSGMRTQWVMHEYQVQHNDEANVPQEYKSLCKIFMQASKKLKTKGEQLSLSTNAPNDCLESHLQCLTEMKEQNVAINSKIVSLRQQDSSSRKGKDIYETCSAADSIDSVNGLANEDYIEVKGLLSSDRSASTSEVSSSPSEEYFDSDALLSELLNDQNTTREIHEDCKHNIAGSTKSEHVVISPPEQGLVHNHDNNVMVAGTSLEKGSSDAERDQYSSEQCLHHPPPASSCSQNSHVNQSHSNSSSSSHGSTKSPQKDRSTGTLGKIGKKYCCFRPF